MGKNVDMQQKDTAIVDDGLIQCTSFVPLVSHPGEVLILQWTSGDNLLPAVDICGAMRKIKQLIIVILRTLFASEHR